MSYEPFLYFDNKASAKQLLSSSTRWSKRRTFYSRAYPSWSARALALLILLSVNLVIIICFIAISMYNMNVEERAQATAQIRDAAAKSREGSRRYIHQLLPLTGPEVS